MSTTSKLGADMTDEPIAMTSVPLLHYQDLVRKAGELRALLARQPAAIDNEATWAPERIWLQRGIGEEGSHTWCEHQIGEDSIGEAIEEAEYVRVDAAPLANEASKPAVRNCQTGWADFCLMAKHDGVTCPSESCDIDDGIRAAPSVEQDERGAFEAWARDEGMDLERGIIGAGAYNDSSTQACWRGWKHRARAASTSANVAQLDMSLEARLADAEADVKRLHAEKMELWSQVHGYSANVAQLQSVDLPPRVIDQLYQAAGVSTYHPDGDQQEKLHAFARNVVAETLARLPTANVAQGAVAVATVKVYETYTGQNGWTEVAQEEYDRTKDKYEHRIRRVSAPPAQTALTDDARDAIRRAALEEAAKAIEPRNSPDDWTDYAVIRAGAAATIRALSQKDPQ